MEENTYRPSLAARVAQVARAEFILNRALRLRHTYSWGLWLCPVDEEYRPRESTTPRIREYIAALRYARKMVVQARREATENPFRA